MADRLPLVIADGIIQQKQSTDVLDDVFNLLTSNLSLYVDPVSGDDSNDGSSGSPFETIDRAIAEFTKYAPQGDVVITVNLLEGEHTISSPVTWSWTFGRGLLFDGVVDSHAGVTFGSYDGSVSTDGSVANLEYFDCVATLPSGTAAVGQLLLVENPTGGTNPLLMAGLHEIIGVSGSDLTIRVWRRSGVGNTQLPSGSISSDGYVYKSVLVSSVTGSPTVIGLEVSMGTWNGVAITQPDFPSGAVNSGVRLRQGATMSISTDGLATSGFARGIDVQTGSAVLGGRFATSKCSNQGISCSGRASLSFTASQVSVNGCVTTGMTCGDGSKFQCRGSKFIANGTDYGMFAVLGSYVDVQSATIAYPNLGSSILTAISVSGSLVDAVSVVTTGYTTPYTVSLQGTVLITTDRTTGFETDNDYVSELDFERVRLFWDSNIAKLYTESGASGGTDRDLEIGTAGTTRMIVDASGQISVAQTSTQETSGAHTPVFNTLDSVGSSAFEITAFTVTSNNLGWGRDAGIDITTGVSNFLIGHSAGASITEGDGNYCIGTFAGSFLTTGDENCFIGSASGVSTTTGSNNTALGAGAGSENTTGDDNTFLGHAAGSSGSQADPVSNTIGIGAGVVTTADNQIVIGNSSHDDTQIRGILETTSEPSVADQLWDDVGVARISDGNTRTRFFEQYAAGTAYSLTNSAAAVDFGTTDPVIVLTTAGTYRVSGFVVVEYNGATLAANQAVTLTLRRTNNTASDLTNGTTVHTLEIVTTASRTAATIYWEAAAYTTANADDSLTIFADIATTPSAGSVDVVEAAIKAEMILS